MIDSHCHLHFPEFNEKMEEVLTRMEQAGVEKAVVIATEIAEERILRKIMDEHPELYASIGVHPCAPSSSTTDPEKLAAILATHERFIAIGECGLDRFHLDTPESRKLQEERFRVQLELGLKLSKPVVVHTRNSQSASEEIDCVGAAIEIMRPYCDKGLRAVLHCFAGTSEQAKQALDLGCWLSFTGIVTFKNAGAMLAIAADTPLERMMLETDAPYLAPAPHRGKLNEPSYIPHIARAISDARKMDFEAFTAAVTASTRDFYGLN